MQLNIVLYTLHMEGVKHFVLVHGLCHGAWCWYKLVTRLKSVGHRVTVLDLGGCGVHPKRLQEVTSMSDCLQPLMDFMESMPHDEKVILVGHSFGGLAISLAMETFPQKILAGVFISALMPNCKDPLATLLQEFFKRAPTESFMDCKFTFDQGPEKSPTSGIFGPDYIATTLYQHCPQEDVELAKTLMRENWLFLEELGKESLVIGERYGSLRRFYVVCEGDEVIKEEFQRFVIENSPPEEVKSIAEAGHMVMLSKPQELSRCLQEIAAKC